jgi:hypothetical protein
MVKKYKGLRMKFKFLKTTLAGLVLSASCLVNVASANLIVGDFITNSDLPSQGSGALVYQELAQSIGTGYELELADGDFVTNPSSWRGGLVWMDYNPLTNILLLDSQDDWDFETFDAYINNIQFSAGEHITGISLLSNDLITPIVTPSLSFTDDSIHISYAGSFDFTGNSASFQITTSSGTSTSVPEPSTLAIFALGMIGLASRRFKKQ